MTERNISPEERFSRLVERTAGNNPDKARQDKAYAEVVRKRNAVRNHMRQRERAAQL